MHVYRAVLYLFTQQESRQTNTKESMYIQLSVDGEVKLLYDLLVVARSRLFNAETSSIAFCHPKINSNYYIAGDRFGWCLLGREVLFVIFRCLWARYGLHWLQFQNLISIVAIECDISDLFSISNSWPIDGNLPPMVEKKIEVKQKWIMPCDENKLQFWTVVKANLIALDYFGKTCFKLKCGM